MIVSREFLVFYMWSFIVTCLVTSAVIWIVRWRREVQATRERLVKVARSRLSPYDWEKESNI